MDVLSKSHYHRLAFESLEMSVEAIGMFEKMYSNCHLIPKPALSNYTPLSRPLAIIFYNTFENDVELEALEDAQEEASIMKTAFCKLGWTEELVVVQGPEWTFSGMIESIKKSLEPSDGGIQRCSLFVLCITSHGSSGRINGSNGTSGEVKEIFKVIESHLPGFIPKVKAVVKK